MAAEVVETTEPQVERQAPPEVPDVILAFAWSYGNRGSVLVNGFADHADGRKATQDAEFSVACLAEPPFDDRSKPTEIHTYVRTGVSVDALVAAAVKAERERIAALIDELVARGCPTHDAGAVVFANQAEELAESLRSDT